LAARALDDELPAVGVADAFIKSRSGAEYLDSTWCVLFEHASEFSGILYGRLLGFVDADELQQVAKWWEVGVAA
jgi:hypothetical protein